MEPRQPRHRRNSMLWARVRFMVAVIVPLAFVTSTYVALREYEPALESDPTVGRSAGGQLFAATGPTSSDNPTSLYATPGSEDAEEQEGTGAASDDDAGRGASEDTGRVAPSGPSAARDTATSADRSGDSTDSSDSDDLDSGRSTPRPTTPPSPPTTQPPGDDPTKTPTPRPTEPTATPTTHFEPPNYTPSAPPPPRPTATRTRSPGAEPTMGPPILTRTEKRALEATNQARRRAGCADLRADAALTSAARQHGADMRARGYYSHTSPNGDRPSDRARAAGYDGQVEENIARGLLGGKHVVQTWMSRADSRAAITDCRFVSVGIGAETGVLTTWWTQVLGTR